MTIAQTFVLLSACLIGVLATLAIYCHPEHIVLWLPLATLSWLLLWAASRWGTL